MKLKLPVSTYNWISVIGATIAVIAFFMIVFLFVVSSVTGSESTYLGLVIYILLPGFLILGLILIPIGMLIKTKRDKKYGRTSTERQLPVIDLNNIRYRNGGTDNRNPVIG